MASSSSFDNLISKTIEIFNIKELKNEQKEILKASWEGTDCMAVLPTGFGKSLPYQMLSTMRKLSGETGSKKVVVCTPLLSLMQDQVQRLRLIPDVTALYLGMEIMIRRVNEMRLHEYRSIKKSSWKIITLTAGIDLPCTIAKFLLCRLYT
jgi:superfamily II DNA helicase RecQ